MNKKTLLVLFLMLGALMLASCTPDFSSEELQKVLVDANSEVMSYSLEMKMESNIQTTILEESTEVLSVIESEGEINRNDKTLKLTGSILTDNGQLEVKQDLETYIVDGYMYTKNMDVWSKMSMDEQFWEEQDQVKQIVELIKTGTIEHLNDEKIDGTYYYIIKITPDLPKLAEMLQKQQAMPLEVNFEDIIKEYSATIWVHKQSFIIEKSKTEMTMEFDSGDGTDNKITMSSVVDLKISNINEDTNIELPIETVDAVDLSGMVI